MSNSKRVSDMYIERKDKVVRQSWIGIGIDTKKRVKNFLEKLLDIIFIIAASLILIGLTLWLFGN
jgi:hypothetical protein